MDDRVDFNKMFRSTFHDLDEIIKEMDSTLRHFAFGGFSTMDSEDFQFPFNQNQQNNMNKQDDKNNQSLRDQYLKRNDEAFESSKNQIKPMFPRSFFDQFFNHSHQPTNEHHEHENFDEDLDKKVIPHRESDLFRRRFDVNPMPKFQSHSKSVSVRRLQRPDGSIEEVTTTRDSNGKEETRVTRIIGDKSHSLIERKEADGVKETEEIFNNFDEKNLDDFNKDWSKMHNKRSIWDSLQQHQHPMLKNPSLPPNQSDNSVDKTQTENKQQSSASNSFLSKIYSWFK